MKKEKTDKVTHISITANEMGVILRVDSYQQAYALKTRINKHTNGQAKLIRASRVSHFEAQTN